MKRERANRRWGAAGACIGASAVLAMGLVARPAFAVNWPARSFDNGRTAANTSETTLTQANVDWHQNVFGKLFDLPVDDSVYAQPLYIQGVTIGGSSVNVVYAATVNNTVYAYNADTGAFIWSKSLNNGFRAPTTAEISAGCTDLAWGKSGTANTGIIGTPVIDTSSSTLFVSVRTKETSGIVYRIYGLDITSGAVKKGPTVINPGTSSFTFNAQYENQRPGLALSGGVVYVGFAANCDQLPPGGTYRGWLVGYDSTTLVQTGWFASTGAAHTGDTGVQGGIWMGGNAPSFDSSGNVYIATGNGSFTSAPPGDYGMSVVKLGPRTLGALDSFTPSNWSALSANDVDLGSAGPSFLSGRSNRLIQIGKEGVLTLLSQSALGGLGGALQSFQATFSSGGGSVEVLNGTVNWVSPSATDPLNLYVWAEEDSLRAYRYRDSTGRFDTSAFAVQTSISAQGGVMSLSSNGSTSGTGILWAAAPIGDTNRTLYALNAENLNMLWSSTGYARDSILRGARYNPPTIANGKVFVGTFSHVVSVFGLRGNAHVTGYFDHRTTEAVFYTTAGGIQALSCGPGACWVQQNVDSTGNNGTMYPMTSFSDGSGSSTNGHLYYEGMGTFLSPLGVGELNGSPPSTANSTNISEFAGYSSVPESHASFWDGSVQHVFLAAGNGDGTLHEVYNNGSVFDQALPKCPYTEFGSSPRYVAAYWDGTVEHVIFDCINDVSPFPHELWETYFASGTWFTHAIASTANNGAAPSGQFAGGAFGGVQGILGIGPAGSNTLTYTSFASGIWKSVSIAAPSVSYNSTVVVYPDSAGLRFFFVGANGHVYSLSSPGVNNTFVDLKTSPGQSSLASGVTNSVPWTSDLAGFFDGTNDHVFFIGADGFVHEFYGNATSAFSSWFEHAIGTGSASLP